MNEIREVIVSCVSMLQNNTISFGTFHVNLFAYGICLAGISLAGYAINQVFSSR